MQRDWYIKPLAWLMSVLLALSCALPQLAFAAESQVELEGHGPDIAATQVSDIKIGSVDAPKPGAQLDQTATVTTAEGHTWEIPVMWIDSDLQVANGTAQDKPYLPALAFYMPEEYAVANNDDGGFSVTLSDELTKLFGGKEIISVFDDSTGITFILPASLRDFFSKNSNSLAVQAQSIAASDQANNDQTKDTQPQDKTRPATPSNERNGDGYQNDEYPGESDDQYPGDDEFPEDDDSVVDPDEGREETPDPNPTPSPTPEPTPGPKPEDKQTEPEEKTLVDIYCAQTAKEALSNEDLEYLIDLIINRLQPQAVNLLMESFPSFKAASEDGGIGRTLSLYVYFKEGDKDGVTEHELADEALAYVFKDYKKSDDGTPHFVYMLAVDASSLVQKDNNDEIVRDKNGKAVLQRSGPDLTTFQNTIVHEMFHAFMDDYNRTGMLGTKQPSYLFLDEQNPLTKEQAKTLQQSLSYPKWFIEGTASAMENVYTFRHGLFAAFRGTDESGTTSVSPLSVLQAYLNAKYTSTGKYVYFELPYAAGGLKDQNGEGIDPSVARYVSGYLATLYLAERAAMSNNKIGTSQSKDASGQYVFSSEKLRQGLDLILNRLHNGETLDQIIASTSPKNADGSLMYQNASDFEQKFVQGTKNANNRYTTNQGAGSSIDFVSDFLGYMLRLEQQPTRKFKPNGSILFDFEKDFEAPIDSSKSDSADFYQIQKSNVAIESTVPDSKALTDGGKSKPSTTNPGETQPAQEPEQLIASAAKSASAAQSATVVQADDENIDKGTASKDLDATTQVKTTDESTKEQAKEDTQQGTEQPSVPQGEEPAASPEDNGKAEETAEEAAPAPSDATVEPQANAEQVQEPANDTEQTTQPEAA